MDVELLTIGTELLLGFTVDGNGAFMGARLAEEGMRVVRRSSVGDEHARVRDAVREALDRTGTVITCGGLGPTKDDLTRGAVAEVFGRRLVRDPALVEDLRERFRRYGVATMPEANLVQADVPEGATVLANPVGSAPGLWIEDGGRLAILLPGVPKELRAMMNDVVLPRLRARADGQGGGERVVRSRTLRTTGIGESALADKLGDYGPQLGPNVSLAFLPTLAGTDLRLTAWDLPAAEADAALAKAAESLLVKAGPRVYGEGDDDLAAVVLRQLEAERGTLAVAESCTGGLIGGRVTAVPGSSRVFKGGVIAYDDDVKLGFLGVSADTVAAHGAVSEAVAREMAEGAQRALAADAAVAVTGIAGPDGGTDEKPVGTVWIAVRWRDATRAFRFVFVGDREDVRARAAQAALDHLRRLVAGTL